MTVGEVAQVIAIQQPVNVTCYYYYLCRIISSKVEKSFNHHSAS